MLREQRPLEFYLKKKKSGALEPLKPIFKSCFNLRLIFLTCKMKILIAITQGFKENFKSLI